MYFLFLWGCTVRVELYIYIYINQLIYDLYNETSLSESQPDPCTDWSEQNEVVAGIATSNNTTICKYIYKMDTARELVPA